MFTFAASKPTTHMQMGLKHTTLATAAIATAICLMASCTMTGGTATDTAGYTALDTIEWCDSAAIGGAETQVAYYAVCPRHGGTALADSMRQWIYAQFADTICTPPADIGKALARIGQQTINGDLDELKQLTSDIDDDYTIYYEHDIKVTAPYEDQEYTTLLCTAYTYLAGAHGSTIVSGATFRKSDGHIMGWDLLSGLTRQQIVAGIKQGLCGYFGVSGIDELPDRLLLGFGDEQEAMRIFRDDFPLPSTPPYLTDDGVHIIYQQYEIACYAAGMPECTLPQE